MRGRLQRQEVIDPTLKETPMKSLSSTLTRTLASAVITAAALGGCAMMCGARKCGGCTAMKKCGAGMAKCGACGAKCGAKK